MIIVRKFVLGATALLLATAAWAQEAAPQDDVLQRYSLATENLDAAIASLPDDAAASRASLDQAFSALLTLSRGGNGTLSQSIDRVFERARTAIDNRSVTDLAVQTEVLRGGFQRLLYESALTAAVEGQPERARERMLRLAQDTELGEARLERLETASGAGALRRVFEAGVAEQVGARLARLAEGGVPDDRDAAYREFAEAYGDYLLVQDSPRLGSDTNRRFVEAANALVDGDDESFAEHVAVLRDELGGLREAADAGDSAAEAAAVTDLDPLENELGEDGLPLQDAADEGAVSGATDGETPGGVEGDGMELEATGEEAVGPETTEEAALESEEVLRERIEAEREAERRAAVSEDLASFGVAGDDLDRLTDVLLARGLDTVADAEAELAALSSRLGAHVLRGEVGAARARLNEIRSAYEGALAPVVVGVAPAADASLRDTLLRLDEAPALRGEDAALLSSELVAVNESLRRAALDESHALIDAASSWWSGPIRPAAMVLLALLALLPLRLLDLAFGGANRNWRLVGTALFLLLLPVLYEGVAAGAALAAKPLSLPVLATLTTWSVFQNDLSQMVWAGLTFLALVLASIGFYGICVQFGVLGRGRAAKKASATTRTGDDTLVDWDDEF